MKNLDRVIKGVFLCVLAGIAFGGHYPVAEKALKFIDPFYLTTIRYLIVAIVLVFLLVIVEGKKKLKFDGKILYLWVYGTIAFTICTFLAFIGQKLMGEAGTIFVSIMMALTPMMSIVFLWIYIKKKPPKITLVSIIIAAMGVIMIITKGKISFFMFNKSQIFPICLIFISFFAWVIYTIGGTNFFGWSSLRYTALSCVLGNISSVIFIIIATAIGYIHIPSVNSLIYVKWELFYMSMISGVVGVFAWNAGNKILTPMNGLLFINLVPIITIIIAVSSGYKVCLMEVIGAIITIAALISNNLYQRKIVSNNT